MYDLAKRSIAKLEEAWKANVRIQELRAQMKELDTRRSQLVSEADSLRTAVMIMAADGEAGEDDLHALGRAFVAWEAGRSPAAAAAAPARTADEPKDPPEGGESSPPPPVVSEAPPPKDDSGDTGSLRLVDAVDDATKTFGGEFRSEDVRKVLERTHPIILHRVRKASITGALARLEQVGVLERVTPGGRGIEAIFRRKEGSVRPKPGSLIDIDLTAIEGEQSDGSPE